MIVINSKSSMEKRTEEKPKTESRMEFAKRRDFSYCIECNEKYKYLYGFLLYWCSKECYEKRGVNNGF